MVSEPVGGLTATTGTDGFTIDRFNLRQNTAASVPAAMQWDELRAGTSWSQVAPAPAPPMATLITNATALGDGSFQFSYADSSTSKSSTVYASTNLTNWLPLGPATQIYPGFYRFTDLGAT